MDEARRRTRLPDRGTPHLPPPQPRTTRLIALRHSAATRTAEQHRLAAQHRRLGTLFAQHKKLLWRKQHLTAFREPVMLLERANGSIEFHDNITGKEFNVPDLPDGVEKRIHLGKQYQKDFSYAGQSFRGYICHEDYAFPLIWDDHKASNVNSEALRDLLRKVLLAWEKYAADAAGMKWKSIGMMILYIGLGIAAIFFAYRFFGGGGGGGTTATNITNATKAIANNITIITG